MTVPRGLWDRVVGQVAAVELLAGAVARGEVSHAWLLTGPPAVGQADAVAALAADLNCPHADPHACGRCHTCQRIARGTHPAVRAFEPEGAFHVVDAVRDEWIPAATRTLLEGRVKVLHVVEADRMNEAAQNALLKVLEEPPGRAVWILQVADDGALLDTIVSRCRRLDLVAWDREAMRARAAGLGIREEHTDGLVAAAMGSPERLVALADHDVAAARQRHLRLVERLVDEGPGAAVPAAGELVAWSRSRTRHRRDRNARERERLDEAYAGEWPPGARARLERRERRLEREEGQRALRTALDDLASYLRDLLAVQAGMDPADAVNRDHADLLRRDADRVPTVVAVDGLDAVAGCLDALERNGQPELQLERLLLRIAVPLQATNGPLE